MVKELVRRMLKAGGYEITKIVQPDIIEDRDGFHELYDKCKSIAASNMIRMHGLYKATEYIAKANVPGDLVECGVFRGGSSMLMAYTLKKIGQTGRRIYLFDTYAGMSLPISADINCRGERAADKWSMMQTANYNRWCYASLEEVKNNLFNTGYPKENLIFVKGKVEDTLPGTMPESISVLRLDTDWFESTYHSLSCLYPRLSVNGVLIIDDYGHWKGSREAVEKYFRENGIHMLLNRIDYTLRMGIKVKA